MRRVAPGPLLLVGLLAVSCDAPPPTGPAAAPSIATAPALSCDGCLFAPITMVRSRAAAADRETRSFAGDPARTHVLVVDVEPSTQGNSLTLTLNGVVVLRPTNRGGSLRVPVPVAASNTLVAQLGGFVGSKATIRLFSCGATSLEVQLGDGVIGTPVEGTTTPACGETVTYAFGARPGYRSPTILVDGEVRPPSGAFSAHGSHQLLAVAERIPTPPPDSREVQGTTAALLDAADPVAAYQTFLSALADYYASHDAAAARAGAMEAIRAAIDPVRDAAALRALNAALGGKVFEVGGGGLTGLTSRPLLHDVEALPTTATRRTSLVFVNGIFNDVIDAGISASELKAVAREAGLGSVRTFLAHNKTTSELIDAHAVAACYLRRIEAGRRVAAEPISLVALREWPVVLASCGDKVTDYDLGQSAVQYVQIAGNIVPAGTDPDVGTVAEVLRARRVAGDQVIVIPHSQGNFMVRQVLDASLLTARELRRIGVISIAPPEQAATLAQRTMLGAFGCWTVAGDIITIVSTLARRSACVSPDGIPLPPLATELTEQWRALWHYESDELRCPSGPTTCGILELAAPPFDPAAWLAARIEMHSVVHSYLLDTVSRLQMRVEMARQVAELDAVPEIGDVIGTVKNHVGLPLTGVLLRAEPGGHTVTTGIAGTYSLIGLPAGEYSLSATPAIGCEPQAPVLVQVIEAEPATRDFAFDCRPRGRLAVHAASASPGDEGSGAIRSEPAGIACTIVVGVATGTCQADFPIGVVVRLVASPSAKSYLVRWSGACTGVEDCVVTMDAARDAHVAMTTSLNRVYIHGAGAGAGRVTSSIGLDGRVDCRVSGGAVAGACGNTGPDFIAGRVVSLEASADAGSMFVGWSGGGCSGGGGCDVFLANSEHVTARFDVVPTTLPDACGPMPLRFVDAFDGGSVGAAWSRTSGTWSVSGGVLRGDWPLSSPHGEQGSLLLDPTRYDRDRFLAAFTLTSDRPHGKFVLSSGAGSKWNLNFDIRDGGSVSAEWKRGGSEYTTLRFVGPIPAFGLRTPAIVALRKSGPQIALLVNDVVVYSFTDGEFGGTGALGLGAYGVTRYDEFIVCDLVADEFGNASAVFNSTRDGNLEIYSMGADGTGQTRLTVHPSEDVEPAWSPDSLHIAWASRRAGNYDIHVMRIDGSDVRRLTTHDADDRFPRWSPDSKRITFYSRRDGDMEIYVMNADGTGQTRLTNSPGIDYTPTFSPDGTRIAFTSDRAGSQDIWVMDSDGAHPLRLTTHGAIDYLPSWGHDGRIAFSSERDGGIEEIYLMHADGSGQHRLTASPTEDFYPNWWHGLIGFSSNRTGRYQLYILDPGALSVTQLTNTPGDNYAAHWR